MLTHQQNNLLSYIQGYYEANRVMPNFDEMRVALDLRSKSGIHRLLAVLEQRGRIRRMHKRARAIELVQHPADPPRPVPIAGRTGQAVFDPEGRLGRVTPPPTLLGAGEHVGILVADDSMRGSGILRGDVALVRLQEDVPEDDVALFLVEGMGLVLRRCRPRGPALALHPDAPGEELRILPRSRVRRIGRLAGILRDCR